MNDAIREKNAEDLKRKWKEHLKAKLVDCPKCYGEGVLMLPVTYFSREWEQRTCDLCHGTGKIAKEYYDRLMGKGEQDDTRIVRQRETDGNAEAGH